jgi:F-type H+-transporting ATPase subunit delta
MRGIKVATSTQNATGLAGRYATALFDLADSDDALDQVADDLVNLDRMIDGSDDLQRLISSPVIARDDQSRGIIAVMETAEMSSLAQRFVGLVARNRRLFALPNMIEAYRSLLAAHRGEATAEVVSAQELTDQQLDAVGDVLRRAVGTPVSIDARVDPSLLGGLVVRLGSQMVDSSLSTKLQRLKLAMIGVG